MLKMAIIRIDDTNAKELRKWGKSYNDAVKALLDKRDANKFDYDFIRSTMEDCFSKYLTK